METGRQNVLPADVVRADGRGWPWSDRRKAFEGALWILRNGSSVAGPPTSLWRLPNRASPVPELGMFGRDGENTFGAGRAPEGNRRIRSKRMLCGRDICSGQKRGDWLEGPNAARAPRSWVLQTAMVFLFALRTESASPAEVKLVEQTLNQRNVVDCRSA